ncbi:hypothetical protein B0181_08475 [Moraxella caviae]|uniref:Uncharacterized protein n=1 Tax=Moraxella caviae TaxID=34060 RepID=A0A1S9ZXL4_9GAMM|nr:hypothetical protein [Moraxella caviae]OOR88266.1 hypothetical protein B0181_08475 [Moraxella caviae]STZ13898.1 Uncharacterised protein [Moraxella caviae]
MLFAKINHENGFDLKMVRAISQRILDWNVAHQQLSDEQVQKLEYIVKPTLASDQHIDEIKKLCSELEQTLVMTDKKGRKLKFYTDDKTGDIYFGDDAGFAEALSLQNGQS